ALTPGAKCPPIEFEAAPLRRFKNQPAKEKQNVTISFRYLYGDRTCINVCGAGTPTVSGKRLCIRSARSPFRRGKRDTGVWRRRRSRPLEGTGCKQRSWLPWAHPRTG